MGARFQEVYRQDIYELTPDSIRKLIASAFAYMNLIEKWGSGFPRILRDCRDYGLREPEILDFDGDLRVNLYRKTDQTGTNLPVKLNDKEETRQYTIGNHGSFFA